MYYGTYYTYTPYVQIFFYKNYMHWVRPIRSSIRIIIYNSITYLYVCLMKTDSLMQASVEAASISQKILSDICNSSGSSHSW